MKYYVTLLFVCLSLMASAQSVLTGFVKDTKGDPIPGATVSLKGTKSGTISDPAGRYTLSVASAGAVQVIVSAVSYKTTTVTVNMTNSEQNQDVTLADDVFNLDQVVVTGTSTSRTQREMTGSLSQISAKQIQTKAASSVADIVRFIPGVHAEGGGGEVAANIYVRGLPAAGQYKYTPLEEDGMPVQATAYLTSSAQDVYLRPDLGIANLEFARGGSTTLFGVGAPMGVFNFISKKGGGPGETTVKFSTGQYNLYRVDFNNGGSLGDKWQYNLSGFARYDQGPLVTGSPSRGYQLRGNITRQLDNGYVRLYFRTLDDNAQFYLPTPHVKNSTDGAIGNDGNEIMTLNTPYGGNFALVNPLGTTIGSLGNGVTAKGNSVMLEIVKGLGNGWEFQSKTRLSRFEHRFDFWSPGKSFEIGAYAKSKNATLQSSSYAYADNGLPIKKTGSDNNGNTYVTEESITLRNRPLSDLSTDLRLTKRITTEHAEHNLTFGTFGSLTQQLQDEVGTGVLVDFASQPRLVDLSLVNAAGQTVKVTNNGFRQNVASRTYNTFEADRIALYAGDELLVGKLRLDLGVRYDAQLGVITVAESAGYSNSTATNSADASYRGLTGKVTYRQVSFNDFSYVVGANYSLTPTTNLYGSVTKGVYFPELRTFSNISRNKNGDFIQGVPASNEAVYQGEVGVKYAASRLSGTAALFYNTIKNRLQNDIVAGSDGVLREITNAVGSTSTFGAEIGAAYRLSPGLILDANTTLQQHKYDQFVKTLPGTDGLFGTADDQKIDYAGNWVLRQPKFMFNAGLSYDRRNWDLGIAVNHEGKRFADDQNNIELPAYGIVNLRAARSFSMGAKQTATFGLNLYNAFNNRGLTEGDPRVADTSTVLNDPFYNARAILPRRLTVMLTFKF